MPHERLNILYHLVGAVGLMQSGFHGLFNWSLFPAVRWLLRYYAKQIGGVTLFLVIDTVTFSVSLRLFDFAVISPVTLLRSVITRCLQQRSVAVWFIEMFLTLIMLSWYGCRFILLHRYAVLWVYTRWSINLWVLRCWWSLKLGWVDVLDFWTQFDYSVT